MCAKLSDLFFIFSNMKRTLKPNVNVSSTGSVKGEKRGKISISLAAISLLGDKITELDHDGEWSSDNCLWSQLGDELTSRLSIKNTLAIRKYIYAIWHRKPSKLRSHFINHTSSDDMTNNLQQLSSAPSYPKSAHS